jgi:hypothetical protein
MSHLWSKKRPTLRIIYQYEKPPLEPFGKWAESSDANAGSRTPCPNIQPKNDGPKVRHHFHYPTSFLDKRTFQGKRCKRDFHLLLLLLLRQKRDRARSCLSRPYSALDRNSFTRRFVQRFLKPVLHSEEVSACSDVTSFINHVKAQSGKHLTTNQANQLLALATNIQKTLGC